MKLGTAISGSFKTYFKKPLLFSGIYVAAMALLIIFNLILIPTGIMAALPIAVMSGDYLAILSVAGFVMLLYIALSIVVGALSLGGLIKASSDIYAGHSTSVMQCIKFAFGKIWDYIILGLRVFWYTLAWVLILLMILTPLLMTWLGGGSSLTSNYETSLVDTAYAQEFNADDMPEEFREMMESINMEDFNVDYSSGVPMYNVDFNFPPLLSVVFIVLFVVIFYRAVRAFFAFYILFDEKNISTKEALEKSIKVTKGKFWRIIGYVIVFGFIIAVAAGLVTGIILNPIVASIAGKSYQTLIIVQLILNFVVAAIVAPLTILYYYIMYKGFSEEKA